MACKVNWEPQVEKHKNKLTRGTSRNVNTNKKESETRLSQSTCLLKQLLKVRVWKVFFSAIRLFPDCLGSFKGGYKHYRITEFCTKAEQESVLFFRRHFFWFAYHFCSFFVIDRKNVKTTQVASKTSAPLSTFQQLANGQEFLLGNQKHFSVKYGVMFVNFSTKSHMSLKAHQKFLLFVRLFFSFVHFNNKNHV